MARQFEKEVFFKAPVERVWQALTTPEQMSVWMGGNNVITFEPHVGGTVHIEGLFPGKVAVFEPPYRFGWKWDPDNGTEPVEETLTLTAAEGGTRLHLISIAHGRWADKPMYFGGVEAGWQDWLEALQSLVHTGTASLYYGGGRLNAEVDAEETDGGFRIFIKKVIPGGAADQAGIQEGDTLASWNGHRLDRPATFWSHAWRANPGDRVVLELERSGHQLIHAELTLQAPAQKQA
ncbi:MAG TPA: SRPBCC domain-containing protein [Symbiobacteriaceae bacterium]|jgi:uncharacterized protein YndB with AHSA1/START domain|nr:SRPBCC domain-containing protein [Symbiobacteriaceae bacterium]